MDERLGHYRIQREVGHGGMGTVYEAVDEPLGRTVALKVLPPELAREAAFVRRFQRETRTLSTLDHPGIVKILDVGSEGGFHYYAMEFVDGSSLQALLREEGRLDPMRVIRYAIELFDALEHAHQRGIIHRDLKPANILIDTRDRVHLTDFGIAKVIEATRMTTTGGIVGTAEYMSPEQAEGRGVDRRADLYGAGVVLYQALTGRVPFAGQTALEVMQKHRFSMFESPREINPEVPAQLSALIEQLLEKDPARRPPSAAIAKRTLEGIYRMLEAGGGELAEVLFDRAGRREAAAVALSDATRRNLLVRAAWYVGLFVAIIGLALWATRPPSATRLLREGERLLQDGYYKDAMVAFHELTERFPDTPEASRAQAGHDEARRKAYERGKDVAALMESLTRGLARGVIGRRPVDVPDPKVTAGQVAYARAMRDKVHDRLDEAQRKFEAIAVIFEHQEPKIAESARRMAGELAAARRPPPVTSLQAPPAAQDGFPEAPSAAQEEEGPRGD